MLESKAAKKRSLICRSTEESIFRKKIVYCKIYTVFTLCVVSPSLK